MALVDDITPLLITYNEIQNIERTLARLGWEKRILVIDSGSTDGTLGVLARDPRIEVPAIRQLRCSVQLRSFPDRQRMGAVDGRGL